MKKVAESNHCQIIDLYDIRKPEYYTVNPSEFVYLIDNAEYVFTDSFHGSVFSILFEKQFTVFDRVEGGKSMSSRINTLLETFNLKNVKYAGKGYDMQYVKYNIDYLLKKEREKVRKYLINAIIC